VGRVELQREIISYEAKLFPANDLLGLGLNFSTGNRFCKVTVMNNISRRLLATAIAVALFSPLIIHAGSKSHGPLSEDAAVNLLLQTLKRDHVYDRRISLDCVSFGTVEATRIYFEFVMREDHNAKCRGDPETNPVIDRYRVHRASGKIELYDLAADNWQAYNSARTK